MKAAIVDPSRIDYLVAWTQLFLHGLRPLRLQLEAGCFVPPYYERAITFDRSTGRAFVYLRDLTPGELGQLLLDENIRGVKSALPYVPPEDLPGPGDQTRVWAYRCLPTSDPMQASKVLGICKELRSSSSLAGDYAASLACRALLAVEETAKQALTPPDAL